MLATMADAWMNAVGADCLGPFAAANADTEEVHTCFLMPVPLAYAHTMLGHTLTLQNLWNELGVTIIADG